MIEAHDLTFGYDQSVAEVLNHVSLNIAAGSFVCIMGSNGSGKSTLAQCLNGLLIPTGGYVSIDGLRTDEVTTLPEIRKRVGLVFQDPHSQMISLTIERELAFGLENMAMPSDEMHALVNDSLDEFGFRDRMNESPSSLSGGEMQRLALASVMILRPSYLILDEATSLLSIRSRASVIAKVTELREQLKIGIVLITQFPSEALLAERLVVLHAGAIVFDEKPERVFRNAKTLVTMGVPVPVGERLRMTV